MTEKREVIRRLRHGQSIRHIHRDTGVHRTIIRELKCVAAQHGWLDTDIKLPREYEIQQQLEALKSHQDTCNAPHPLDPFKDRIKQWLSDKESYVVIHQHINEQLSISEATVRRYCKKHFPEAPRATWLRPTIPGEIMEVDFGHLGMVYDPAEKRQRKAWVFSARLRHSRRAYRQRVFDQKQETFFRCHVHAFEHFDGVPEKVVPDNLKAAVIKASFTDPVVNRVYLRLAEHYGFLVDPCPPATPRLKGGVENDIKYIKRNFWPRYREQERQRGHDVPYADRLQRDLETWGRDTADIRVIKGIGARPIDLFTDEEQAALKPLPGSRWQCVTWTRAKVQESWRIQVDRAWYSVPYSYIGTTMLVYLTPDTVEIYHKYELITTHPRATRPWQRMIKPEHDPPNVDAFTRSTREGVLYRARKLSPDIGEIVQQILSRKGVDGLRPARGLLALTKRYSVSRLAAACRRALYYDTPEYAVVKRILDKGLELEPEELPVDATGNLCFTFARPGEYFNLLQEVN